MEGIKKFAELTMETKVAIENKKWDELARLMNANFANRRKLYGDGGLDSKSLKMIELGQRYGAACKFPGECFKNGGRIKPVVCVLRLRRNTH